MESLVKYHLKTYYPNGLQLSHDPMVVWFDNYLSKTDCESIIALAKGKLEPAKVSGAKAVELSSTRTNEHCWLFPYDHPDIMRVSRNIAELVGLSLDLAEAMQVIRYLPGQEYKAHYDSYAEGSKYRDVIGQRMITALCYLSDVTRGGETEFPKLKLKIPAKQGGLLIFENTYRNTNHIHENSLHAGCPVVHGEKWAFNLWFREYTRN